MVEVPAVALPKGADAYPDAPSVVQPSQMEATAARTGEASAAPLNERGLVLLIVVVEVVWLAAFGYVLSLIP